MFSDLLVAGCLFSGLAVCPFAMRLLASTVRYLWQRGPILQATNSPIWSGASAISKLTFTPNFNRKSPSLCLRQRRKRKLIRILTTWPSAFTPNAVGAYADTRVRHLIRCLDLTPRPPHSVTMEEASSSRVSGSCHLSYSFTILSSVCDSADRPDILRCAFFITPP